MDEKKLRKTVLAWREALTPQERKEKSTIIQTRLMDQPEIAAAQLIFTYVDFRSEVQTRHCINQWLADGKKVAVPVTLPGQRLLVPVLLTDPEKELFPGYCGIPEPVLAKEDPRIIDPCQIDTVIVPGSVFDRHGGRMGYGGGYYDRFLSGQAPGALRIGCCYQMQLVEHLELQPHDQPMDLIVTECRVYRCHGNREL